MGPADQFRIVKQIHFCYGHRLLDYNGKCAHPHGHNGLLEIELVGTKLDALGMVLDFGEIKRVVEGFVDEHLDHRMLLRRDDPLVAALRGAGEEPFLMDENPTAENIARLIYHAARERNLPVAAIRLWETHDAFAEYSER
jgi:6-pyruvoyltetrahydropterin/6-carboxytetrahydropterin synthase